jgi:hypothetical protein
MREDQTVSVNYPDNVPEVVEQVMTMAEAREFVAQKRKIPRLSEALGG